ncbi:MAG: cupredoxin domain-containing protein [Rhodothermales bacterium]|nr:cupredoxin domain-containing protein [Rhodothermales bacterium]
MNHQPLNHTQTMNRMKRLPAVLFLALTLAACGGDAEPTDADRAAATHDADAMNHDGMDHDAMNHDGAAHEHAAPATAADAAAPQMQDGIQVLEIEATTLGFRPRAVQLEGGVPTRLVFTRRTQDDCLEHVRIPAFDVEKTALPIDEPVAIEFTPEAGGTFTFVCGMDMQKGTVVVEV